MALVAAVVAAVQLPGCSERLLHPHASVTRTTSRPAGAPAPDAAPSAVAADFAACRQFFPGAVPAVAWPGRQRGLCFDGFAVLYSGESKTPVYTVERLDAASVRAAATVKRVDRFYPEARLPASERAQLADYARSGFDRGHMAPAGDMASDAAKAQSFSLANMVPQAPELNQHDWSQIETATRRYAARAGDAIYVFTGPHFTAPAATIGAGRVWVPSHTWKLVYSPREQRAWAYWMDNQGGKHALAPIGYGEFVQRSGLALLPDGAG